MCTNKWRMCVKFLRVSNRGRPITRCGYIWCDRLTSVCNLHNIAIESVQFFPRIGQFWLKSIPYSNPSLTLDGLVSPFQSSFSYFNVLVVSFLYGVHSSLYSVCFQDFFFFRLGFVIYNIFGYHEVDIYIYFIISGKCYSFLSRIESLIFLRRQ